MKAVHSNVVNDIQHREYFGHSTSAFRGKRSQPLRSYRILDFLPSEALRDIILGFTSDGQFLVSYLAISLPDLAFNTIESLEQDIMFPTSQHWSLRFWHFSHPRLKLVTEIPITVSLNSGFGTNVENVEIRFCETPATNQFVLIILNLVEKWTFLSWGSMPEVGCRACLEPGYHCPRHQTLLGVRVCNDSENVLQVEPSITKKDDSLLVSFFTVNTVYVVHCSILQHDEKRTQPLLYSYPRSKHALFEGLKLIDLEIMVDNYCAMCYSMFSTGELSKLLPCRERHTSSIGDATTEKNSLCIICSKYFRTVDISEYPCHASLSQLDEDSLDWATKDHKLCYHSGCSNSPTLPRQLLDKVGSVTSCRPLSWLTWLSDKCVSYSHHYFAIRRQLEEENVEEEFIDSPRESQVVDFSYEVHNPYVLSNTRGNKCQVASLAQPESNPLVSYHLEELAFEVEISAPQPTNCELRRRRWSVKTAKFLDSGTLLIEAMERRKVDSVHERGKEFSVVWDLTTGSWRRFQQDEDVNTLLRELGPYQRSSAIRELNNKLLIEEGVAVTSQKDALGMIEVTL